MVYKKGTPEYDRWRKSPEYDLWRTRISAAMTGERHPFYGKHHSIETCAKQSAAQSGERNPNYGKCFSAETRANMGAARRGKRHSVEVCAKIGAAQRGRRRSEETLTKMSAAKTGKRNPNWCGGVSFDPYPVDWNNRLREMIRKRDNYICALCRKEQNKRQHSVHHINYNKKDTRPENLVTLCTGCHLKTNDDREYWTNLFVMVYVPNFPKERIMKDESYC